MSSLLPCTQCRRHVRADDVRCPFCSAELTARAVPRWLVTAPKGTKRATLFAIGMGLASACETSDTPIYGGPWVGGGGGSGGQSGAGQGVDGGTGGVLSGGSGGDGGSGNVQPVYGAPVLPEPDASSPDPSDAAADAGPADAAPALDAGDAEP